MQSNKELGRRAAICEFADIKPRRYHRGAAHPECTNRTKSPRLIVLLQQRFPPSLRRNRIVRATPLSGDGCPDGRQHEEYAPSSGSCYSLPVLLLSCQNAAVAEYSRRPNFQLRFGEKRATRSN